MSTYIFQRIDSRDTYSLKSCEQIYPEKKIVKIVSWQIYIICNLSVSENSEKSRMPGIKTNKNPNEVTIKLHIGTLSFVNKFTTKLMTL